MNKTIVSRPLLLEQLEYRCLLAASIFEYSMAYDSPSADRSAAENRSHGPAMFAGQTGGGNPFFQPRINQHQDVPRRDSQGSTQLPIPQPVFDQRPNDRPRPDVALPQPKPPDPSVQFAISSRTSVNTIVSNSNNGPPTIGSTSLPGRDSPPSNSTVWSPTTLVATENVHEENAFELPSAQLGFAFADMVLKVDLATHISPIESTRFQQPNWLLESSSHPSDQGKESVGGLIEVLPALRYEFDDDRSLHAQESWHLDNDTLQQLRSAADGTNDDMLGNSYAADVAIANWFGNSTGLIDDIQCAHELPANLHELTPSIVDVVPDATVGLHRSVGLIVDDDIKTQPNYVRDSILATISAEYASRFAPLPEQATARIPGIAYPGVAIVVSTLAFANRQRRNAKLESPS